jgi:putative membrane protein
MDAARGSMAEVELGRLATQKASSPEVKQFGQRMVDDHTKANDELKTLAQGKSITIPTDLDAKHQATRDRLSKLSGAAFDRAYMQEMVADHRKNVDEFRKQSQSGKDAEVKAWAAKTLPTLEEHLKMAQSASRGAVGTSGSGSSGGSTGAAGREGSRGSTGSTGSGGGAGSTGSGNSGRTPGAGGSGNSGTSGGSSTPGSGTNNPR